MKKYIVDPSGTYNLFLSIIRRYSVRFFANQYLCQNMLLLITNVLAGGLAYLLHPLLGRLLTIQEYGEVAIFISLALIFFTLTQMIATASAKYISLLSVSKDFTNLRYFLRSATAWLLSLGMVATLIFALCSGSIVAFFHLASLQEPLLLSLVFLVLFAMPLNQGSLQGLQFFGWYALITLLIALLRLILSLGFVLLGFGVNGVILGIVLSQFVAYMVSCLPLYQSLRRLPVVVGPLRTIWSTKALVTLMTTGIVSLGIVLLSSLDTLLARHFLSASDTGLYAALATIGRTTLLITSGIAIVMFPRIVSLYKRGEAHSNLMIQAMLGTLGLALIVELLFCAAPNLLTKLLFGPAFLGIVGLLPLYGLAMLFLACTQTLAMYFLAVGKHLFSLLIIGACLLETALIIWRHAGLEQFVQNVLLVNAGLTLTLCIVWLATLRRERKDGQALELNKLSTSVDKRRV